MLALELAKIHQNALHALNGRYKQWDKLPEKRKELQMVAMAQAVTDLISKTAPALWRTDVENAPEEAE